MEPAVAVASLQNRSQAADEKTQQNEEEKESLTASKDEMGQTVSNESQEHLTGILKGNYSTVMVVLKNIGKRQMSPSYYPLSSMDSV